MKKPFIAYGMKREGETNAIAVVRGRAPAYRAPYQKVVVVAPIQNQQPYTILVDQRVNQQHASYQPQQQQQQCYHPQQQQQRHRRPERRFDKVYMPHSHILPYLLRGSLLKLRELGPSPTFLPLDYDANSRCKFHSSAPNHSIENCKALKYKVQDLIDSKGTTFAPNDPNVNNNPMSPHNNPDVNTVEVEENNKLVSQVDEVKTPLIDIKNIFMKSNLCPLCDNNYENYLINPQECEVLKTVIQKLIDQGILVVEHLSFSEDVLTLEILYDQVQLLQIPYDMSPMTISINPNVPLVIIILASFPFGDTKAKP